MDIMSLFMIFIIILVVLGIVMRCIEAKEYYYIIFGGREFKVYCYPDLNGKMCEVTIYEIVHPKRKCFKTKYRCYKTFWVSDFETIKQGIYAMIDNYIIDEQKEKSIQSKWKEMK